MKLRLTTSTPAFIFQMVHELQGQDVNDIKLIDIIKLSETCSAGTGVQPCYLRECFIEHVQLMLVNEKARLANEAMADV